jgi:hypothetical protein
MRIETSRGNPLKGEVINPGSPCSL